MKLEVQLSSTSVTVVDDALGVVVGDNGALQVVYRDKRAWIVAPGQWFSVRSYPEEGEAVEAPKPFVNKEIN